MVKIIMDEAEAAIYHGIELDLMGFMGYSALWIQIDPNSFSGSMVRV